jgi:hypothetical protein
VLVWEKQNGKWMIDSDIWNMNAEPEAQPKAAAGNQAR